MLLDGVENVSNYTAKILLLEAYDTAYQIADYSRVVSGLDYVKLHPAEDTCKDSLLYDAIGKFAKRGISKMFGISLIEFMELPRDVSDHMYEVADEVAKVKSDIIDELTEET